MKNIEELAKKFNNDKLVIAKELKRVQSLKCRLVKQKFKKNYEEEMSEILSYEQQLKEARALVDPKEKPVTYFNQDDVKQLDYDQTIKAIKSIQSKKALTRWLTPNEADNHEFRKAVEIEKMLLEHKKTLQPVQPDQVRKTELQAVIETLENNDKLSKKRILELLKELV